MTNAYGSTNEDPIRATTDRIDETTGDLKAQAKRGAKDAKKAAVAASGAIAEAATTLARDTRVIVEEKVGKAKANAEVQYDRLKKEARIRAREADTLVHERPYAALTAAALAGFLIGHLISSNRTNVVYLRDDHH
jgi:ElaB/YqjD/DUF883 family membrane-anchored ribosome-binding protein